MRNYGNNYEKKTIKNYEKHIQTWIYLMNFMESFHYESL